MEIENEYNWYTQNLDIVDFLQYHGYKEDSQTTSRQYRTFKVESETNGSTNFFVFKGTKDNPNSNYNLLKCTKNILHHKNGKGNSSVGNVIDVAILMFGSYKDAMYQLRSYSNIPTDERVKSIANRDIEKIPAPVEIDNAKLLQSYHTTKNIGDDGTCKYLNDRGISKELLADSRIKPYINTYIKNGYENVLYPAFSNEGELICYQVRNHKYRNIVATSDGMGDCLWLTEKPKSVYTETVIFGETPEDVLSYIQLNPTVTKDSFWALSTFGSHSEMQVNRIAEIITSTKAGNYFLVQDKDAAGLKYRLKILSKVLKKLECPVELSNDNVYMYLTAKGEKWDVLEREPLKTFFKNIKQDDIVFSNQKEIIVPNKTVNHLNAKIFIDETVAQQLISNIEAYIKRTNPYLSIQSRYSRGKDFNEDLKMQNFNSVVKQEDRKSTIKL